MSGEFGEPGVDHAGDLVLRGGAGRGDGCADLEHGDETCPDPCLARRRAGLGDELSGNGAPSRVVNAGLGDRNVSASRRVGSAPRQQSQPRAAGGFDSEHAPARGRSAAQLP